MRNLRYPYRDLLMEVVTGEDPSRMLEYVRKHVSPDQIVAAIMGLGLLTRLLNVPTREVVPSPPSGHIGPGWTEHDEKGSTDE